MEDEWASLAQMIGTHPDWIMLGDADSKSRVIDIELASTNSDSAEGSPIGPILPIRFV
jgi:hypothetical protein